MKKVVVTGAAGFLGRHVVCRLADDGAEVLPLSRRAVEGMVQVRSYQDSPGGDLLIHLGEEADRGKFNRDGDVALEESKATVEKLAARFGDRLIYASSAVVYGDDHEEPCSVDTPTAASDAYSRSKLVNERIVLDAGGSVLRLSNLFGRGMASSTVLSDILSQIPGAGPLRVRDDRPVRDFLDVSEAAAAFACAAQQPFGGVVNVGSGVGLSVRRLAELALGAAVQSDRAIVATRPSERPSTIVLDTTGTRPRIGWAPRSSVTDQLINFFNDAIT